LLKANYTDIFLYTSSKECDFIVKKGNDLIAIQATFEIDTSNREREIARLKYVQKKLNISKSYLVTFSQSEIIDNTILMIPIYKPHEINK